MRRTGRVRALAIALSVARHSPSQNLQAIAATAAMRIERETATEASKPDCPPTWLEGLDDIHSALLRIADGTP